MSAIQFHSPSHRAGGSDLSISVSPLGLIELSDEEFEVHGPRLSRYATYWAWYLGHHWSHRREQGEPQISINYVKAFTEFIANFSFGQGVRFHTPKATSAIVPSLLQRVWEVDNDKENVLWNMAIGGGVTGDCFIKVAYEEPWVDTVGRTHPGRVRILPLNSSHVFPEWHPHDRERLERVKIKYRFWATDNDGARKVHTYCVDDATEALTRQGWKRRWELSTEDEVLAVDPEDGGIRWEPVQAVNEFDWDGPLTRWQNKTMDALTTPNHRWMVQDHRSRDPRYADQAAFARFDITENLSTGRGSKKVRTGGGTPACFALEETYSDEFVELIGWVVTEGTFQKAKNKAPSAVVVKQSQSANPEYHERLSLLAKHFAAQGYSTSEKDYANQNGTTFYFGEGIGYEIRDAAPDKQLTPEFLLALTEDQARLLYETLLDGDGHRRKDFGTEIFAQQDEGRLDGFQALCAMLGRRTHRRESKHHDGSDVTVYRSEFSTANCLNPRQEHYTGKVWCPSVRTKTWLARRNGVTYWTGNTEVLTDHTIQEFTNDEMISERPNPIGQIPIVHIPNKPVPGSPWGISDCNDITDLNREYNEKSTDISDIINYHAAPVTIITGAKASQLEKGPNKVWGGLPKDSNVFNLELGGNLAGPLQYLELLKRSMHEMTGVPETALGQRQPISNTSGVALAITFQPMMNTWYVKRIQYGKGIEHINELVMLTLAVKEPHVLQYDPTRTTELKDEQYAVLDPSDPLTYRTTVHFPPPLPTDVLVKLNEIQSKMTLGLESKRGALRELGEEFPEEKMQEIFDEVSQDAKEQAALDLLKAHLMQVIAQATGTYIEGDEIQNASGEQAPKAGSGSSQNGDGGGGEETDSNQQQGSPMGTLDLEYMQEMMEELVTKAHLPRMSVRRDPQR